MSSSPEAPVIWAPPDLREAMAPVVVPGVREFPVFEVATAAGVPEPLLDEARAAAHASGYAAGWAHGVRAAELRAAETVAQDRAERDRQRNADAADVARATAALRAAADVLEQQAIAGVQELESLLLESAYTIAETLVGHALRDDESRAPAALARTNNGKQQKKNGL